MREKDRCDDDLYLEFISSLLLTFEAVHRHRAQDSIVSGDLCTGNVFHPPVRSTEG